MKMCRQLQGKRVNRSEESYLLTEKLFLVDKPCYGSHCNNATAFNKG